MKRRRTTTPVRSFKLSNFARNLLESWRHLSLPADANVVVAVSGGADSTALMLAIEELINTNQIRPTATIAHLDHGLRAASADDARWVSQLAKAHGFEVVSRRVALKRQRKTDNLEQAARKARYAFLEKVAKSRHATFVLTAHTMDDQAETVLMRLLRGSAAEGLSGIPKIRPIARGSKVMLARPLVNWARRLDTEKYCVRRGVEYLTDEMNDDDAFMRVRVRKQLVPLMESFNNRIVETLSRTAVLLEEDAAALAEKARHLLELAVNAGGNAGSETNEARLNVDVLLAQAPAVRRRALREWLARYRGDLRRLEKVHLLAVDELLQNATSGRTVELPGGIRVVRRRGVLELSGKKMLKKRGTASRIRGG